MKKIIFSSAIALLVLVTACVKDKNFDDQKLGIPNTDVKGVSFPQSKDLLSASKASDTISVGTDVNQTTSAQTNSLIIIGLESEFTSPTDVNVAVALKPTLIPSGYIALPAGTYSIPATVKIPAGQKTGKLVITFSNTSTYSLTANYAIGLTITSADAGYQVANNSKDIVASFAVKNQYDGTYDFKGYAFRAGDPTLTGNFCCLERDLLTTGATSVAMDELLAWSNGSGIGIGNQTFSVDPITNAVVWGGVGGSSLLPGYNSRYVPATKTFYIGITWGAGPAARQSIDTLTYLRPR
jgi:hypothetical protein